jgi:N6-L-threonylcarbamoyladenine synthase
MVERAGHDFSFSGLKTAAQLALRGAPPGDQARADLALAFESAIVETLLAKTQRALEATARERLVVAGGVGANRRLRERLQTMADRAGIALYFPRVEFCTDNAAMIALAGLWRLKTGEREGLPIRARARWPLDAIQGAAAVAAENIA